MALINTIQALVSQFSGKPVERDEEIFQKAIAELQITIGQQHGDLASHHLCDEWMVLFNQCCDRTRALMLCEYVNAELIALAVGLSNEQY